MSETLAFAGMAFLAGGCLIGWLAYREGQKDGEATGYIRGWRECEQVGQADTGRPKRGADGRFKPKQAA